MSFPRVVIGAGPKDRVPAKVCEWSIRTHHDRVSDDEGGTGSTAEVIHTFDRALPTWSGGTWTAFSFVRWWIPDLLERRGRAIYLDSDMLVFANIQALWDLPMDGKAVLRHREPSVLVIDCEKAGKFWSMERIIADLEAGRIGYAELMRTMNRIPKEAVGEIPDEWNHLDSYRPGETKLLHFTTVRTQPWRWERHPQGRLWYEALGRAVRAGVVPVEWLQDLPRDLVKKRLSRGPHKARTAAC